MNIEWCVAIATCTAEFEVTVVAVVSAGECHVLPPALHVPSMSTTWTCCSTGELMFIDLLLLCRGAATTCLFR